MKYGFRSLFRGNSYRGLMHTLNGNVHPGKWTAKWDASLLSSDGPVFESTFLRHRDEITRSFGSWIPGIRFEQERNEQLLAGKIHYRQALFIFRIADVFYSSRYRQVKCQSGFTRREDDGIKGNTFVHATTADMAHFGIGWNKTRINALHF
ncbi:MAG: hypothetical protein IPJ26_17545 [Bacteroidetes bacterium]|nr:hypothetical protein [Bacteroidota bacterium]